MARASLRTAWSTGRTPPGRAWRGFPHGSWKDRCPRRRTMPDDRNDTEHAQRLLDDAYAFERGEDFTAAVSRARAATLSLGRFGPPSSLSAAEVAIAASRF